MDTKEQGIQQAVQLSQKETSNQLSDSKNLSDKSFNNQLYEDFQQSHLELLSYIKNQKDNFKNQSESIIKQFPDEQRNSEDEIFQELIDDLSLKGKDMSCQFDNNNNNQNKELQISDSEPQLQNNRNFQMDPTDNLQSQSSEKELQDIIDNDQSKEILIKRHQYEIAKLTQEMISNVKFYKQQLLGLEAEQNKTIRILEKKTYLQEIDYQCLENTISIEERNHTFLERLINVIKSAQAEEKIQQLIKKPLFQFQQQQDHLEESFNVLFNDKDRSKIACKNFIEMVQTGQLFWFFFENKLCYFCQFSEDFITSPSKTTGVVGLTGKITFNSLPEFCTVNYKKISAFHTLIDFADELKSKNQYKKP